MWYALAHSMNLPTIDLYRKTGHVQLDYLYRKLGFSTSLPEEPAVALGAVDVSLKELVTAYSAFASDGKMMEPFIIERIEDNSGNVIYQHPGAASEQVMSTETAEFTTLMLEKAAHSGTGRALYSRYGLGGDWASKTGTSQNFSDARFMVYNPSLVTGVWVGAYDPAIHFSSGSNGSGARLALPVAAKMLQAIESDNGLKKYRAGFRYQTDTTGLLSCQGKIDNRSMKTILDAVVGELKGEHKTDTIPLRKEKKKKESKVKKFFKKLFGGGKK
jgi:penicillin-binding protein 1A